jgi:hypothetical protein
MNEIGLSVPRYDAKIGVTAPVEGCFLIVDVRDGVVEIFGDPAGLRDLGRWCLALSGKTAPPGVHIHLDPGTIPLELESIPLMLARKSPVTRQRSDGVDPNVRMPLPARRVWTFHHEAIRLRTSARHRLVEWFSQPSRGGTNGLRAPRPSTSTAPTGRRRGHPQ